MNKSFSLSRRRFLLTATASTFGTLVLHGCTQSQSQSAVSQSAAANGLETTTVALGFLPVVDCAPLVVAKEKGFFAKYGMTDVRLAKQPSWAALRDNVELGSSGGGIDGGQFQSPIPELISEGIITKGNEIIPMYTLARLNTHSVGISLASKYQDLRVTKDSSSLKQTFAQAKAANQPLKCAITFPRSSIDLWLHYWLAAGGIDPTSEASILVVPPAQVVSNLKRGTMDLFCATDPWNSRLVNEGAGFTAATSGEIWKNHPEKAFAMRAEWVDRHPKATIALLQAILEAQQWCDQPEHHRELAALLVKPDYTNAPLAAIEGRLSGRFDYGDGRVVNDPSLAVRFWSNGDVSISYPFKSHDLWFLVENLRWGKIPADLDLQAIVNRTNRDDLWKEAAKQIGVPTAQIPTRSSRGVETFFDGIQFDPDNPQAYLQSLKIRRM
ncbi:CmpA/NrtA family ABC transporter substrate-binding protein [Leptolyngbya ohadii]|uniref:CmpA/NrtA family ABC transporter substrate-binding protein n=1 Tax=Leptolyngbya ohadii TaxID=1962290 RepID=UPI000B59882D|nr:CmpA/NrtA family ABC transporter substrate-binding protein [Leptolyngbya ohadii]